MNWACTTCTFVNDNGDDCGMCGQKRPKMLVCPLCSLENAPEEYRCGACGYVFVDVDAEFARRLAEEERKGEKERKDNDAEMADRLLAEKLAKEMEPNANQHESEELVKKLEEEEKEREKKYQESLRQGELEAQRIEREEKEKETERINREAIDKIAAAALAATFGINTAQFDCPTCFDEVKPGDGISLLCSHHMCKECFENYLKGAIAKRELLKCPQGTCGHPISARDVKIVLGGDLAAKYSDIEQINLKRDIQGLYQCKTTDCPNAVFVEENSVLFHCMSCKKKYCIKCDVEYHDGSSCEQFQKWKKDNAMGDDAFDELIKKGLVKKCECGKPIFKDGGCAQVTCKCGIKFCWDCKTVMRKHGDRCAHTSYH